MGTGLSRSSSEGRWRLPPPVKVLEALGAIADGRVRLTEKGAQVVSSEGDKVYTVRFDEDSWAVGSTDNGSVFKGYYGYPIVAFLMLKGYLPLWKELAEALKGIPWRRLNERYRRYWLVEKVILEELQDKGFRVSEIKEYIRKVLDRLKELGLGRLELGQQRLF